MWYQKLLIWHVSDSISLPCGRRCVEHHTDEVVSVCHFVAKHVYVTVSREGELAIFDENSLQLLHKVQLGLGLGNLGLGLGLGLGLHKVVFPNRFIPK